MFENTNMDLSPEVLKKIEELQAKYDAQGQDLLPYLDGLLNAKTINYWDYIQVDSLLSLQKTRTDWPDELVFIGYHQVTELYFKLTLYEFSQIAGQKDLDAKFFITHVKRINRYFEALTKSFEIMVDGMDREQFLKFRMTLHPASGFQSAQYRLIEIASTDFLRLVDKEARDQFTGNEPIEEMIEHIYWKKGGLVTETGKSTLTLSDFERRYREDFIKAGNEKRSNNLWQCYLRLPEEDRANPDVIHALKQNDINVNVNWPLAHYKSAVRYLQREHGDIAATGGTNWQKYLPPRFQKRIFYPSLWTEQEKEEWGKAWVESVLA